MLRRARQIVPKETLVRQRGSLVRQAADSATRPELYAPGRVLLCIRNAEKGGLQTQPPRTTRRSAAFASVTFHSSC
jgi:hypothetical protein